MCNYSDIDAEKFGYYEKTSYLCKVNQINYYLNED